MADLSDFIPLFEETLDTVRARFDADVNAGLESDDPDWMDTREGSFYFDLTQLAALEIARLWDALALEVIAAAFPLYAWGIYLDYHAAVFNLERKAAVAATGEVTFTGDPGTFVGDGTVVSADAISDESGTIEFQATEAGTTGDQLDPPADPVTATPSASGGALATATYYYRVSAYNEFGETTGTVEVSADVTGPTGEVALDWADVTDAVGYRVYRSTEAASVGRRIYSDVTSDYTDDGAATPTVLGPPEINSTAGTTLLVEAVETGGVGNLAANAIVNLDTAVSGVTGVYNALATSGGTETESDDDLRTRILYEFEGQGAGTENDYRRWSVAYPGVGEAHVEAVGDGPGTVVITVMDSEGDPVSGAVLTGLLTYLNRLGPVGTFIEVQTPTIVTITGVATLTFVDGYNLDGAGGLIGTVDQIEAALRDYVDNLEVSDDVIFDHFKAKFFTVPGVLSVGGLTVNGGTSDIAIAADEVAELATPILS